MIKETFITWNANHRIDIEATREKLKFVGHGDHSFLVKNPDVTDNGKTVGERNREAFHRKLDAWLDGTWEKDSND
jgi:hypothetical protein